eukprot:snap_masked-scaffold_50-processed-gene-1.29-mRNA-1 protein AED:1.00 eAED:1.00 QI:0/0/0/0/1/1/2/0/1248
MDNDEEDLEVDLLERYYNGHLTCCSRYNNITEKKNIAVLNNSNADVNNSFAIDLRVKEIKSTENEISHREKRTARPKKCSKEKQRKNKYSSLFSNLIERKSKRLQVDRTPIQTPQTALLQTSPRLKIKSKSREPESEPRKPKADKEEIFSKQIENSQSSDKPSIKLNFYDEPNFYTCDFFTQKDDVDEEKQNNMEKTILDVKIAPRKNKLKLSKPSPIEVVSTVKPSKISPANGWGFTSQEASKEPIFTPKIRQKSIGSFLNNNLPNLEEYKIRELVNVVPRKDNELGMVVDCSSKRDVTMNSLFSTGNGKALSINKENLVKARKMVEPKIQANPLRQEEIHANTVGTMPVPTRASRSLFSTGSGKKIELSEENIMKARNMLQAGDNVIQGYEEKPTVTSMKDMNQTFAAEAGSSLFSTGNGKKISIDETALSNARLKLNQEGNLNPIAENSNPLSLFSTGTGKKLVVSKAKLSEARRQLSFDVPSTVQDVCRIGNINQSKSSTSLFSTGSGKRLAINDKAVKEAKKRIELGFANHVLVKTKLKKANTSPSSVHLGNRTKFMHKGENRNDQVVNTISLLKEILKDPNLVPSAKSGQTFTAQELKYQFMKRENIDERKLVFVATDPGQTRISFPLKFENLKFYEDDNPDIYFTFRDIFKKLLSEYKFYFGLFKPKAKLTYDSLIAWKIYWQTKKHKNIFHKAHFCINIICGQVLKRYYREYILKDLSVFKKLSEHMFSPFTHYIILIYFVLPGGWLIVSDGYYLLPARLNKHLSNLYEKSKNIYLKQGRKIHVCGASFANYAQDTNMDLLAIGRLCADAVGEFQSSGKFQEKTFVHEVFLNLGCNNTKPVVQKPKNFRKHLQIGEQKQAYFSKRLSSVALYGGIIPCLYVYVSKIYGIFYCSSHIEAGTDQLKKKFQFHNETEEELLREEYRRTVETIQTKIMKKLSEGQLNPDSDIEKLIKTHDDFPGERNVTQLIKFEVVDGREKSIAAIVSWWKPPRMVLDCIKNKKFVKLFFLNVSSIQRRGQIKVLKLKSGNNSFSMAVPTKNKTLKFSSCSKTEDLMGYLLRVVDINSTQGRLFVLVPANSVNGYDSIVSITTRKPAVRPIQEKLGEPIMLKEMFPEVRDPYTGFYNYKLLPISSFYFGKINYPRDEDTELLNKKFNAMKKKRKKLAADELQLWLEYLDNVIHSGSQVAKPKSSSNQTLKSTTCFAAKVAGDGVENMKEKRLMKPRLVLRTTANKENDINVCN